MDSIRPYKNYTGGIVPQAVLNGTLGTVVYASNYNDLDNKPSINSVELRGNKTAEDLGLATPEDITVTSVNNQTGDVSLTGQNIPYDNDYSVNEKINDIESQITGSGVSSVNGKTGVVNLTGTDIEYSAGVSLNAKIDAVEREIPVVDYPVTSVNNKTGAVNLTGSDIEYSAGVSINTQLDNVAGDLADLTAEEIPMSGTDSTPVATAVGDLSQLSTSVQSSLVGAVNELTTYIPVWNNTASGAIATFDTSLALPLQDCTIAINAVQEGSGTPLPDNVRPITGFTGANIHVADNETPHIIDNVTSITWQDEAGTVYGGSLDVTSGVLTVTFAGVDLGSLTWTNQGSGYFTSNDIGSKNISNTELANAICSHYPITTAQSLSSIYPAIAVGWNNHGVVDIRDTDYTSYTAEQFATAMNGVMLVYELATPQTYQLTPTQISAIVGTNNVFTDTNGNSSVVYACSLKDYIDSQ